MEDRSLHSRDPSVVRQPMAPPPVDVAPPSSGPPHHGSLENARLPRSRNQVRQPPLLTTSLSALQSQRSGLVSAGPTPSSSLSSPFSQANPSPYPSYTPSSGERRGTSPMPSRLSEGYAAAYNPQEWGPVLSSPQIGSSTLPSNPQHGPQMRNQVQDEDTAPPPYSPRRPAASDRAASSSVVASTEDNSPRRSRYQNSFEEVESPAHSSGISRQPPSRPVSIIHDSESATLPMPSYVPPPPTPPANSASRPPLGTAVNRVERSMLAPSKNGHGTRTTSPVPPTSNSFVYQTQMRTANRSDQTNMADGISVPPSSKRAVSMGAIGPEEVSSKTSSQSGSKSPSRRGNWAPGMPLPGPPPGPPPSASRSHSAGGVADGLSRYFVGPATRPKPRHVPRSGTSLGAVPPTPTDWVDTTGRDVQSVMDSARTANSLTLSPAPISASPTPSFAHPDVPGSCSRSTDVRNVSVKGIRQRRSESRNARENQSSDTNMGIHDTNPWANSIKGVIPADLPLPAAGRVNLARRRTITRSRPRTPGSSRSATLGDHSPRAAEVGAQTNINAGSARSTPRLDCENPPPSTGGSIQTPPFSPSDNPPSPCGLKETGSVLPPKSLPTPPPQQQARSSLSLAVSPPQLQVRPISHILHLPNEASGISEPLSPRRLSAVRSQKSETKQADRDSFVRDGLDRARAFLEKEYLAEGDDERLQLFSEYILAESRIRRRRYTQSFKSFDTGPSRAGLFELSLERPPRSRGLQQSPSTLPAGTPSQSQSRQTSTQRRSERTQAEESRPESMWWTNYQPALSPIASLSMNDEQSSRGRTPSRWWESQTGSETGGGSRKLERSKRESKYMGLPLRDVQLAIEGEDRSQPGSSRTIYGTEEYPPEKVGWHESEAFTSPAMPPRPPPTPTAIDFSRLITLPPPYPRHYPAVQNQHPDLHSYRTLVRNVSDLAELDARRTRYQSSTDALRKEVQARIAENARNFRINIQAQIEEGGITFAEAAEAEAAMKGEQHASEKQRVQAEFDSFQDVVLNPLHDLLNGRINQTTRHLDELRTKLVDDAQLHTPNETLTAGDERPELLEQLSQFKWLFEAREQLHREVFKILTERNDKYQAIVTLPYQHCGNKDKIRETVAFFARDTQDRTVAFESAILNRHTDFLSVIEDNVLRGVEAQLSAFWDIAPALLAICQKIPDQNPHQQQASDWPGIQIPPEELEESPSYCQFPMQYLYSLLLHAERSTYQFIESQINLLCLLHEVRTGVMAAQVRCWEVEKLASLPSSVCSSFTTTSSSLSPAFPHTPNPADPAAPAASPTSGPPPPPPDETSSVDKAGGPQAQIKYQAQQKREVEEKILTTDLKDRVATVEGQWTEALGATITGTRDRVKGWLVEEGGWDDELSWDGVCGGGE